MISGKFGREIPEPQQAVTLALLGRPRILRGGTDVTRLLKYRKGIALLGYLAAHAGTWFSREQLADLLWPDYDIAAARTNLRQVLNNLSALLNNVEEDLLQKDGVAVALVPHRGVRMDITLLSDAILDGVAADVPETREWREREVEPWTAALGGEFLASLQLPDTPEFDAWLEAKRVQFRARAALLLEYLCRAQHAEGRLSEAVASARQLVAVAPFDEKHNLQLMTLLAELGDAPGALEAFDTLQQSLSAEMGVAPGERLVALRDAISRRLDNQAAPASLRDAAVPEMRYVAALYCASDLLHADEPETDFAEQVEAVVQQRGGMLVSSIGQGMLAVFGLGESAERATQRAVLAARDLLAPSSATSAIEPRIGISAGRILLRRAAGMPHLAGQIPDVAKLIGWSAQPGEILASEVVALQAGESFRFEPVAETVFQGFEGTHRLYRVAGRAAAIEAASTPFSGRAQEFARLRSWWEDAVAGRERIAVLRAPAGLGKTRLASELMQWVAEQGGRVRRIQCDLEHQHQPLAAVLVELGGELEGGAEDVASKSAVFDAVIALVKAEAAQTPILLVIDDLHWSDLATRELLGQLARTLESQRLLLVVTTRPEVTLDYPESITHIIDIAPLDEAASLSMIAAHDPDDAIPVGERAQIAATCAGIPLFIERQVRSRLEGGHHRLSITELLQGELDRFGPNRSVLHAAAVLGIRFERRHLTRLLPDAEVPATLARAAGRNLITAVSAGTCAFRHALIRDAAYESLTSSRRRLLHEKVARLFQAEEHYSPEEIAQHFSAAGCREEAVDWWIRAGDRAMDREFAADAMASYQQALDQLAGAGAIAEEALVRALRMRLGYAAHVAEGYGSPLTYRLFADMVAEIEAVPDHDPGQMFAALAGCYMGGSSFAKDEGLDIARRLQALARAEAERLMACFALGNTLFWLGDFEAAAQWQRQGMALAAKLSFSERMRYGVDDPAVTCRAFNGWTLWFLGREADACAMVDEAVAVAREGRRAHGLCFALVFAACLHWYRGDVARVAALAGEALALSKQYGFPLWEGGSGLLLLWAQAASGTMADARNLFGAAAMLQQALPSRVTTSRWIVVRALLALGEWQEAEKLLDTALREVESLEEQYCVADLIWLKGECLDQRGARAEAQEHRRRALALAREQGAQGLLRQFVACND